MKRNMLRQFPEIEAAINELAGRIERMEAENADIKEKLAAKITEESDSNGV